MSTLGDTMSTPGGVQFTMGYHEYTGEYSVHWGDTMSTPGVYHDEKFTLKIYGRYPDLIGKYQRSAKDMMPDSFPD